MGVARQRQRDAFGHLGKDVGLVRHQDHRRVAADLCERAFEIVDAAVFGGSAPAGSAKRPLVAEAGQPELVPVLLEQDGPVLVDGDARGRERGAAGGGPAAAPLHQAVVLPVMVAEHGVDAERRLEPRQLGGVSCVRERAAEAADRMAVVAEQQHDIGAEPVDLRHQPGDPRLRHPRP